TLTVEEINPLSVRADRTETDPAEPVGFTARADEEMRNLEWAFVAGDTLPESGPAAARAPAGGATFSSSAAAAPAADWNALASCRRKEACTTRIAASGRMWVRGHIEDQIVFARSEVVRVQPVRLKLDCTPNPVTRGQSITCTASKDPASAPGELKITGWSFEGRARTDGDVTSNTWAGVMVNGGRIQVAGTIGEIAVRPEATRIKVDNRVWHDPVPPAQIRKVGCSLPLTDECPLGSPPVYDRDLGQTKLYPESGLAIPYAEINSGPNTGWSYVSGSDAPIRFAALVIFLNEQLYDRRSDLYRRSDCRPSDLASAVEVHEESHADHAQRLAERGYVNMHFESLVRFAPKERFREELSRLVVRNLRNWMEEMVDQDHSTIGYLDPGCETRLRRNPR
ncbi:MAG TPA: hypothetical protein VF584_14115, partial [Longimicrobium sp.]